MAKTRMNNHIRETLRRHVKEVINPKEETKKVESTYKKVAPLVRQLVQVKFPPKDMRICQKYKVAFTDDCIKLRFPNGVVDMFHFHQDHGPLVTQKTTANQIYLADEDTYQAFEAWKAATEKLKTETKKRQDAYNAVITNARCVEDIIDVWPEAAECVPSTVYLPSILSPEQIQIMQADIAERAGGT